MWFGGGIFVPRRINAGIGSNGYLVDAPISFEGAGFASTDAYTMAGIDNGQVGMIEGYHAKAGIDTIGYATHNLG